MDNNILREIISVEKEIQLSLDQAREAARIWLDARKKDIQEELEREERKITEDFHQSQKILAKEASSRADELVMNAQEQIDAVRNVDNETLSKIVANHINAILPGDP